jgi:hypothetical protein
LQKGSPPTSENFDNLARANARIAQDIDGDDEDESAPVDGQGIQATPGREKSVT